MSPRHLLARVSRLFLAGSALAAVFAAASTGCKLDLGGVNRPEAEDDDADRTDGGTGGGGATCGTCSTNQVCCAAPEPCAGQCVPDCRTGPGCLTGTCDSATGVCMGGSGPGGGDGGSGTSDCAQAANFLDVSKGSAGGTYAAPTLSVKCTASSVEVTSNSIPNFAFNQVTPNALKALTRTWSFPKSPAKAASSTAVPLTGPTGVAVNGLVMFGPTEAPQDGYKDPIYDNLLDYCAGHTAPDGMYHFHGRPDCLFTDMTGKTSLVIAYAFDGFPILAPYVCTDGACTQTKKAQSSWQKKAGKWNGNVADYTGTTKGSWDLYEYVSGSGDLDECNGKDQPGGGYAYYATDTFPYFMGCYKGTKAQNGPPGG